MRSDHAGMAKLVDAPALGADEETHRGSSPLSCTSYYLITFLIRTEKQPLIL
jgi:hypothetical protein